MSAFTSSALYRNRKRRLDLRKRARTSDKTPRRVLLLTLLLFVPVSLLLATGGAGVAVVNYFGSDLPNIRTLSTVQVPLSTYIFDRSGQHLLYTLEDERRELIDLAAVPPLMQQATVAIEDRTFWTNPGVDVTGIARAVLVDLGKSGKVQGGSTITQQLVKLRITGDEATLTRKIKEAFLAIEAARTFSKQQILEMYFNQIYYGNQAYGLRAAAKTYFGISSLEQLSVAQIALLAGLPQAPADYDPLQHPAAASYRRGQVLDAMVDTGYLTPEQATVANAEPIKVSPAATSLFAPHFTFRVREQLVAVLGERAAYRGGYRVLTSLDWDLQLLAEKQVRTHVDGLKSSNVNNAALITMDPATGEVLAYVGSKDYYDTSPQVQGDYDVAGIGLRQPGSTFKLFTYLTGMLKANMTAATVLNDIEFNLNDGSARNYHPKDATTEQHGPVTIRQSLRESLNLPALNVTRTVGVDAIIDTIHQLGIPRDWDRSQLGLSFGIGAGEMRLIEMTSAYQVIANKGVRVEPTLILQIRDSTGKVVKDYSKPEGRRVLDERQAWVMTDILKDNTDPLGSFVFGPITNISRPAALKTGTTDNLQDVLAIGFIPQRLTAVWMGNSNNEEMHGISSALGPGTLWRDYMKEAVGYLPVKSFERPEGIVERVVCVNPSLFGGNGSGKLPGPYCPAGFRRNEFFVAGTEPTTDDRDFYTPCGIRLRSPFPDWQKDMDLWAAGANSGRYAYGRYSWRICGGALLPGPVLPLPAGPSSAPSSAPPSAEPTPIPAVTPFPLPPPPSISVPIITPKPTLPPPAPTPTPLPKKT